MGIAELSQQFGVRYSWRDVLRGCVVEAEPGLRHFRRGDILVFEYRDGEGILRGFRSFDVVRQKGFIMTEPYYRRHGIATKLVDESIRVYPPTLRALQWQDYSADGRAFMERYLERLARR